MARRILPLFKEVETDLAFPLEGLDETRAYMRQRRGTTASANNVRSFEPATDRARGGQRHGMVKYFPTQATGAFPIQDITSLAVSTGNVASLQATQSPVTPAGSPAPTIGQLVYGRTAGNGFGLATGANGTSLWTSGSVAGYQFACSCWDPQGNLYVAEVKTTTGAVNVYKLTASGGITWLQSDVICATGSLRNVAGMVVINGLLYVAITAASAPTTRIIRIDATAGTIPTESGSTPIPYVANGASLLSVTIPVNISGLAFSTNAVNCIGAVGNLLGIESTNGKFYIVDTGKATPTPVVVNYSGLTANGAKRSKVVSDGNAYFYALISTTAKRIAKISAGGVLVWTSSVCDTNGPQDLVFDPTGPNYLVACQAAAPSVNVIKLADGTAGANASPGATTAWHAIGSDGQGNFTLWRDGVATNDALGVTNSFSTVWGPKTFANTTHTGASVNRVPVSVAGNIISVTNPGSQASIVNTGVSLQITASDSDVSQALSYVAAQLPAGLSIGLATGLITGTPTNTGTATVAVTVSDATGAFTTVTFTWSVTGGSGNTVSVTNPGTQSSTVGTAASLQITATDSAGQTLNYNSPSLPAGLAINPSTGLISGTPRAAGNVVVSVNVTDPTGATGSCSFQWNVTGSGPTPGPSRAVINLVVSGGELRTFRSAGSSALSGGIGAFSATAPVVWSAPCLQRMFYVDGTGYVYYDAATNAVRTWAATSGTLPVDVLTLPARLIALWNGRIVLSGLPNDPANWFMSAQLDPFNWNYTGTTTGVVTQAVAGNNSPAGKVGDVITALIPYRDDTLLFGAMHSIWQMTGDPANGGQITCVSQTLGMAWGRPYAIDPMGIVYFMGSDRGIYKLVPGALPVRISQAINKRLVNVDLSLNLVRMAWDMRNQGLAVFITPYASVAASHYFWEERTNSWWPQSFANVNHDPLAVWVLNSDVPGDEVVMLGGRDGYVRAWQETAVDDDGTAIASFVVLGPLMTKDLDDLLLKDLQATLGPKSGPVAYSVYVGATAEAALASSPVATGTWAAGRNVVSYVRRSGIEVYVKLSATAPWAIERINARYAPMGRIRQRGTQN